MTTSIISKYILYNKYDNIHNFGSNYLNLATSPPPLHSARLWVDKWVKTNIKYIQEGMGMVGPLF